ncbi:hypothetical protein [Flavobacterium sp. T12S277]|uniref:hypothetical protein n=1 Tax=Flavobacterium sp. T12S277 TaxID=3402752 RepID=UPI003AECA753
MAPSRKKYFIYIIFLVFPVSLSLYAQNTIEVPTISIATESKMAGCEDQNIKNADQVRIGVLDNSNQLLAGLSIPKDSLSMATVVKDQNSECNQENRFLTGSFSILAKDIIENYKYDFSETFIDILFFEDIDLARTRTI